jgi:uncharacterized protein
MDSSIETKLAALRTRLQSFESLLVAYSGGTDSTFLLHLAHEALGTRVKAVIGFSALHPRREHEAALRIAAKIGSECITVPTREMEDPRFTENPPNRCYYCKHGLFTTIRALASEQEIAHIAEGTTSDEALGFRPGMQAVQECAVLSPLREVGFTKAEVRAVSRARGLSTWDKPSQSCLATRLPYGERINASRLERVENAEEFLHRHGVHQVRIRVHGEVARIEAPSAELGRFAEELFRVAVVDHLKRLGFVYVSLDLEGYRTGSMDEVLPGEKL